MSKIVKIMYFYKKKVHVSRQNCCLRQNTANRDKWLENIEKGSHARKQHYLQHNIIIRNKTSQFATNGITCNNKAYTVSRCSWK